MIIKWIPSVYLAIDMVCLVEYGSINSMNWFVIFDFHLAHLSLVFSVHDIFVSAGFPLLSVDSSDA